MRWITDFDSHGSVICHHRWRTRKILNLFSVCSVQLIFYLLYQAPWTSFYSSDVKYYAVNVISLSTTCSWINIHHAHRHLSSTLCVMLRAWPSVCLWGIKDFWKAGIRVMEVSFWADIQYSLLDSLTLSRGHIWRARMQISGKSDGLSPWSYKTSDLENEWMDLSCSVLYI